MAAAGTWKSTRGRSPAHSAAWPSLSAISRIVCSCASGSGEGYQRSEAAGAAEKGVRELLVLGGVRWE